MHRIVRHRPSPAMMVACGGGAQLLGQSLVGRGGVLGASGGVVAQFIPYNGQGSATP